MNWRTQQFGLTNCICRLFLSRRGCGGLVRRARMSQNVSPCRGIIFKATKFPFKTVFSKSLKLHIVVRTFVLNKDTSGPETCLKITCREKGRNSATDRFQEGNPWEKLCCGAFCPIHRSHFVDGHQGVVEQWWITQARMNQHEPTSTHTHARTHAHTHTHTHTLGQCAQSHCAGPKWPTGQALSEVRVLYDLAELVVAAWAGSSSCL